MDNKPYLGISLINDYQQLWGKWNWYTFHLIHFYIEKNTMIGLSYEISIAILGIGITVIYTPYIHKDLLDRASELESKSENPS